MKLSIQTESKLFAALPLKDRKFAKTRIRILEVFLSELETKSFEEIKIKEIAKSADISEPTFYNYFPEKDDLILLFIQVWSLSVSVFSYESNSKNKKGISGYSLISAIFRYTARESKKNSRILLEIISLQARTKKELQIPNLTLAERLMLFPNTKGIESFPSGGVEVLIEKGLMNAIENKELPKNTNISALGLAIGSLFFGAPILCYQLKLNLETMWLESLKLLWLGAGGNNSEH